MEENEKNGVLKNEKKKKGWGKKGVWSGGVVSECERSEKGLKEELKRPKRISVSGE